MTSVPALHAEAVPADPSVMRWVFGNDLPACGRLVDAPGMLGKMIEPGGLIVRAVAERRALWTWLAQPSWATDGVAVREAVYDAAARLNDWRIEPAPDDVLALVAADVIDRTLERFIASHGGEIALIKACHNEVDVQLGGACKHCPVSGMTLHGRIAHEIRERTGEEICVKAVTEGRRRREPWRLGSSER